MGAFHKLIAAAAVVAIAPIAAANAGTVFSENFDGMVDARITGAGAEVGVGGFAGQGAFAGSFRQNASGGNPAAPTTLTLNGLGAHTTLTVDFDLAIIDSWDGDAGPASPDFFGVRLDGGLAYLGSFEYFRSGPQSTSVPVTTIFSQQNKFGAFWWDQAYHVSLVLPHVGASAVLDFLAGGNGWQGGHDESWAIDNLVVQSDMNPVPVPAALPLLASALGLMGFVGRRRKKAQA